MTGNKEMKIVLNKCFGGFSLSPAAIARYAELADIKLVKGGTDMFGNPFWFKDTDGSLGGHRYFDVEDLERNDPHLVRVVEELGTEAASGPCARLEIFNVDEWKEDTPLWVYDGKESLTSGYEGYWR